MTQLGRISGQLLKENLLRDGEDLFFKNYHDDPDLLTLSVTDRKISIKALGSSELNVEDTFSTNNLIATNSITVQNNLLISTNTVSTTLGQIVIQPRQVNPLVTADQLKAGDIDIKDNIISNYQVNGTIRLDPNGSGILDIHPGNDLANTRVNGDLEVTGNININGNLSKQGNIIIGDTVMDTVTIGGDFSQSIIPGDNNLYNLGSPSRRWREAHIHSDSQIGNLFQERINVSDSLKIDGTPSQIYTYQSNEDVLLQPPTGIVDIESIRFQENDISNLVPNTSMTIASTGIGYVRFMDTSGIVIPAGSIGQRPDNPEVGDTRWNTDYNRVECFDGSVYLIATGPGAAIGAEEMQDIQTSYILMFG
jgi:hypothetical protein